MGVYIPGMEMPKSCAECPCFGQYDACDVTGSWKWKDEFDQNKERLPDCPLIQVPPHGRLIDADALMELEVIPSDNWVFRAIEKAPTIIPEEEGK